MREAQTVGPYVIVCACMGATVGLELAHRLSNEGEKARLVMIDPRFRRVPGVRALLRRVAKRARDRRLRQMIRGRIERALPPRPETDQERIATALQVARDAYVPEPTTAPVALLSSSTYGVYEMPDWYLARLLPRVVFAECLEGTHDDLFRTQAIDELRDAVANALVALEHA
jgi:thioesterase domain-containing protein